MDVLVFRIRAVGRLVRLRLSGDPKPSLAIDQRHHPRQAGKVVAHQILSLELDSESLLNKHCPLDNIERVQDLLFQQIEIGIKFSLRIRFRF